MLELNSTNTTRYAIPSSCKESNFLKLNIDELNLEPLHNKVQKDKSVNVMTKQPKTDADNLLERPLHTSNTEHPETHVDELTQQLANDPYLSGDINASIDMNREQNYVLERLHDDHSMIRSPELLNSLLTIPLRFQDDLDSQQKLMSYNLLTCKTNVVKPTFKDFSDDVLVHLLKTWCIVQGSRDSIWHRWKSLRSLMLQNKRK